MAKKKTLTDLFIGVLKKNPLKKAVEAGVREGRGIIGKSLPPKPKKKPRKPRPKIQKTDVGTGKVPTGKKRVPVFGSAKDRAEALAQAEAELESQNPRKKKKK